MTHFLRHDQVLFKFFSDLLFLSQVFILLLSFFKRSPTIERDLRRSDWHKHLIFIINLVTCGKLANERSGGLNFVGVKVVPADLRVLIGLLEMVFTGLDCVVFKELLHSSCLVLMRFALVGEETNCAELRADDECVAVLGEPSLERVVHHVAIDRVDAVLAELLDDLLVDDVPKD